MPLLFNVARFLHGYMHSCLECPAHLRYVSNYVVIKPLPQKSDAYTFY